VICACTRFSAKGSSAQLQTHKGHILVESTGQIFGEVVPEAKAGVKIHMTQDDDRSLAGRLHGFDAVLDQKCSYALHLPGRQNAHGGQGNGIKPLAIYHQVERAEQDMSDNLVTIDRDE
jgi:hypothetical protein